LPLLAMAPPPLRRPRRPRRLLAVGLKSGSKRKVVGRAREAAACS